MSISVVICSIRGDTLQYTVDSIRQQTFSDWELIIVGQGSDAVLSDVMTRSASEDPRVHCLHLSARGLSRARNAGADRARGDIVAFTDDDCVADSRWLEVLAESFQASPALGLIGGAVIAPTPRQSWLARCPAIDPSESVYRPGKGVEPPPGWGWIGANFAVRREVLREVGHFDECLGAGTDFPAGEDTDYLLRLEARGVVMGSTPRAVVRHEYGYRYGLRAVLTHSRNYARGNGALAGKLTLLGDPRGEEWLRTTREECLSLDPRRLPHVPTRLVRYRNYVEGYNDCLASYAIADGSSLLELRPVSRSA